MGHDRTLPLQLKAIRKKWGLSIPDLAAIIDVSDATLDNWEQGRNGINLDKLTQWADALGYDLKLELRKSR